MRRRFRSFRVFVRFIGRGMAVEWRETKEIPLLLWRREYRKAGAQVADICKMAGLGMVWIVPGGAVLSAAIVKFSHRARPSAFQKSSNVKDEEVLEEFAYAHQNDDTQQTACDTGKYAAEDDSQTATKLTVHPSDS